ncbi:AzlC family ABC transporter permease [Cobetia marina]|jgi:4-azaleucine resistance transporter AzlC|uniref:AzlC family ABC transporter permease n=1 Tax=Cobetia TaxID=204286 RepID=UPI00244772DD|nr:MULTISPECIES: AzlC family ABC transporter permease [Cobetia]MDH2289654.1 AzlC family ABC transporter permease [Cobetia sp. 10Alg 146]MDO6786690.1 AzlC family ABC transporter permease [Cobetia marina]
MPTTPTTDGVTRTLDDGAPSLKMAEPESITTASAWLSARQAWREALRQTLPVMFGYIPLGAAFGVLFTQLPLSPWLGLLMSVIILAGAGQFLAVALLGAGAGVTEVAVATLLLNSRHLFYGLSLLERFREAGIAKLYLIFGLTDETYSLLSSLPRSGERDDKAARRNDQRLMLRITALNQLWWVLGTALGLAAGQLTFDSSGIEFALTALFVVLGIEQWYALRERWPFLLGLVITLAGLWVLPQDQLLLGSIAAASVLLLGHYLHQQRSLSDGSRTR